MKESLVYYRKFRGEDVWEEISYEEALDIMLGSWRDNDMTRDMLSIPNYIECIYSTIVVKRRVADAPDEVSAPGLLNLLPTDVEYDEDGNRVNDETEEVLRISRIDIKSETFCTTWNGKLYCVDICEDAEERSAWLYNSDYGVKMLMWGENVKQSERDEYLDLVFSNLPDYIEDYAKEYEVD